jgi:hypothetical protein
VTLCLLFQHSSQAGLLLLLLQCRLCTGSAQEHTWDVQHWQQCVCTRCAGEVHCYVLQHHLRHQLLLLVLLQQVAVLLLLLGLSLTRR